MEEFVIESEEDMLTFGEKLASELPAQCVIALVGDLGAGKTHLSKGICRAYGHLSCTSPTYTLVNELESSQGNVYHFDLYRIKTVDELLDLGWDNYLSRDGVVVAEWADLYPEVFPDDTVWIRILPHQRGRIVQVKHSS